MKRILFVEDDPFIVDIYANQFKNVIHQHENPLVSFPKDYDYYGKETKGMINGNLQENTFYPLELLSIGDQMELHDAWGVSDSNIFPDNSPITWYRHIDTNQGGGGETNRDEVNPFLFYQRAGSYSTYPGGHHITKMSVARHRMEASVRYLEGESCADYEPNEWNSNNNNVLEATNNLPHTTDTFWEQEHS